MNANLTYDTLKAMLRQLEEMHHRIMIALDDLLPLLRHLRKQGYEVYRDPYRLPVTGKKRSIWFVKHNGVITSEIYVDTTRSLKSGMLIDLQKLKEAYPIRPEIKLEFPEDTRLRTEWWRYGMPYRVPDRWY